jgi:thymidylate synthase
VRGKGGFLLEPPYFSKPMGDPDIYSCREWQQERFMQQAWKEDILRRAEANMHRRREGEEADAVRRLIERSERQEIEREKLAWAWFFGIIFIGFLTALLLWIAGVQQ